MLLYVTLVLSFGLTNGCVQQRYILFYKNANIFDIILQILCILSNYTYFKSVLIVYFAALTLSVGAKIYLFY